MPQAGAPTDRPELGHDLGLRDHCSPFLSQTSPTATNSAVRDFRFGNVWFFFLLLTIQANVTIFTHWLYAPIPKISDDNESVTLHMIS